MAFELKKKSFDVPGTTLEVVVEENEVGEAVASLYDSDDLLIEVKAGHQLKEVIGALQKANAHIQSELVRRATASYV